jgi:septum formation protein
MNVILASASPRRAQLLKQLNIDFIVDPSDAKEEFVTEESPGKLVRTLARMKGKDVAKRHPESFLIAADTIVWFQNRILGKPAGPYDAKKMLRSLSNRTHEVYSGVYSAITGPDATIMDDFTFYQRTNVTFSALNDQEIEFYISSGSPFDKAGAYGIQDDIGSLFVKKIEGDYYNVVGFPINKFYQQMKLNMPLLHQKLFFNIS